MLGYTLSILFFFFLNHLHKMWPSGGSTRMYVLHPLREPARAYRMDELRALQKATHFDLYCYLLLFTFFFCNF